MEFVVKYLKTLVGRHGMFNLVLMALEKILDNNFVCPCRHKCNHAISFFYAFVPALGCFICTMLFVDLSRQGEDKKEAKRSKCTIQRFFYSILFTFTCVSLYFLDGRYWACAYSDWDGVYVSDTLGIGKWCKPIGNETSELERQQRTQDLICTSQITGFILLIVVIIFSAIFKCIFKSKANTGEGGQGNREEGTPMNPTGLQTIRL